MNPKRPNELDHGQQTADSKRSNGCVIWQARCTCIRSAEWSKEREERIRMRALRMDNDMSKAKQSKAQHARSATKVREQCERWLIGVRKIIGLVTHHTFYPSKLTKKAHTFLPLPLSFISTPRLHSTHPSLCTYTYSNVHHLCAGGQRHHHPGRVHKLLGQLHHR